MGSINTYSEATPVIDDMVPFVDDPSGSWALKRSTISNLLCAGGVAYYPDPSEVDQGATAAGSGDTIYDIVTALGTSDYGVIVLRHTGAASTTTYTFDTSETIPGNIKIVFQNGARIARTTGDEVLTFESPGHIIASPDQILTNVGMIAFSTPGKVTAEWWGAIGDGSTSDSANIQYALAANSSSGGGIVQLLSKTYACANLEISSNVTLRGVSKNGYNSHQAGVRFNDNYKTVLLANAAGDIVVTPSAAQYDLSIENINFVGAGGTTLTNIGLHLDNVHFSSFRNLTFDNFGGPGIQYDEGIASSFYRCHIMNCILGSASLTGVKGAIELGVTSTSYVTDCRFDHVESTIGGRGSVTSANLYAVAWHFTDYASDNFLTNSTGQTSDIGFYISGNFNSFNTCRADLNEGHGVYLASGATWNQFDSCRYKNNSQDTTATYDGFYAENGAANNSNNGCVAYSETAAVHQYGFNDLNASSSSTNVYSGCWGNGNDTGLFNGVDYLGAPFSTNQNIVIDGAANSDDTTPSIANGRVVWIYGYSGATTWTDMTGGTPGQEVFLIVKSGGAITLTHGASIETSTGANLTMVTGKFYHFINDNGVWRHITN